MSRLGGAACGDPGEAARIRAGQSARRAAGRPCSAPAHTCRQGALSGSSRTPGAAELHLERQQPSRGHSLAAPHLPGPAQPGPEAPPSFPGHARAQTYRPRSSGARATQLRLFPATQKCAASKSWIPASGPANRLPGPPALPPSLPSPGPERPGHAPPSPSGHRAPAATLPTSFTGPQATRLEDSARGYRPDFSAAARVETHINETSTIAPGTSQRNGKVPAPGGDARPRWRSRDHKTPPSRRLPARARRRSRARERT
ncbi:uncharacterized protein LOC132479130 [Mesoplodon densirostris]|uniref:uncharacterized protein LOC132479130 n=1 Tax=Mesoplodon densirostris TaxID=48708 RepID=UPI0028DB9908|nr:uncharacterized protein LOC132479130 [Mesoplodon densirostris]